MPSKALDRETGQIVLATINPAGIRTATCPDPTCGSDVHYVKESIDGHVAHWRHSIHSECPHATRTKEPLTHWHVSWQARCDDPNRVEVPVTSPTGERAVADIYTKDQWAIEPQHSPITDRDINRRERVHRGRILWLFDAASANREGEARFYRDEFLWDSTPGLHRANVRCWTAVDMGGNKIAILPRVRQHRGGTLTIPRTVVAQYDYDQFTDRFINAPHTPLHVPPWDEPVPRPVTYTYDDGGDLTCRYQSTGERVRSLTPPSYHGLPCAVCGTDTALITPGSTCYPCWKVAHVSA